MTILGRGLPLLFWDSCKGHWCVQRGEIDCYTCGSTVPVCISSECLTPSMAAKTTCSDACEKGLLQAHIGCLNNGLQGVTNRAGWKIRVWAGSTHHPTGWGLGAALGLGSWKPQSTRSSLHVVHSSHFRGEKDPV